MTRRVYCGKKTKIYVPKTVNPQIISYKPAVLTENPDNVIVSAVKINESEKDKS